jgi:ubiquinone/menaquinone biosynthesis C-methylase UbiE
MAEIANHLTKLYDGYFPDDPWEAKKNSLAARDSVDALVRLAGGKLGNLVDIGAGDGVVIQEIHDRGIADRITALEISSSGIQKINDRQIATVVSRFNGYSIPFADKEFDTAVCSHVVEHVEHERMFLQEVRRVVRQAIFVVPLEGGFRGRIDRRMGHINYYSPLTFRNLIETCDFEILSESVFPCSFEYEKHLAGRLNGTVKAIIRRTNSLVFGSASPHLMNYLMAVHCVSN